MIYFTADYHFMHEAIIKYCNRPFANINRMDRTLIHNHNEIVKENDTVYIVGDFTLKSGENKNQIRRIVNKLNGILHLVLGNHDCLKPFDYEDIGFASIHTWLKVEEFILVHDPAKACVFPDKTVLTGHIHNLYKQIGNVINIGVDVWDFTPVSIEQIRELINNKKEK